MTYCQLLQIPLAPSSQHLQGQSCPSWLVHVQCTEQKDPIPTAAAAEQGMGSHQEPAHPMQETFVVPACSRREGRAITSSLRRAVLLGPQCWDHPHLQHPGLGCSSSIQQLCCGPAVLWGGRGWSRQSRSTVHHIKGLDAKAEPW